MAGRTSRVAGIAAAVALCASAAAADTVLTARVTLENGQPLSERWVWVVWDQGAPFRFQDGDRREVLNPRGRTESDGALRLEIPDGFFAPGDPLALAWEEKDGRRTHFTALHGADGRRLRLRLEDVGEEEDLGPLTAPRPDPD